MNLKEQRQGQLRIATILFFAIGVAVIMVFLVWSGQHGAEDFRERIGEDEVLEEDAVHRECVAGLGCMIIEGVGADQCDTDEECIVECTDSDGGNEPGIRGDTRGYDDEWKVQGYVDECADDVNLREYSCTEDGQVRLHIVECPGGCAEGACV